MTLPVVVILSCAVLDNWIVLYYRCPGRSGRMYRMQDVEKTRASQKAIGCQFCVVWNRKEYRPARLSYGWHQQKNMLTIWICWRNILKCWIAELLKCWNAELLNCWNAEMLNCWNADDFKWSTVLVVVYSSNEKMLTVQRYQGLKYEHIQGTPMQVRSKPE